MLHPADATDAAFQAACPVVGSIVRTLYTFPNKLRKLPPFRIFLAREGMLRDLPPAALIDWQRDVQNTARRNVHDVYQPDSWLRCASRMLPGTLMIVIYD